MKRVLCLYRVSTKGQVDAKDDIPMQRRECLDFINRMEDWVFYDERMEKGVSGYKLSSAERDVILEIKDMARKKLFDVLLVFMFDRLGRREDDTTFLVQWLVERGIEVWSTREGQQRFDTRADKLINYIRYWQAGGESEKTSMRVKAVHTQMTADGIWRGGTKPFGYKLVHRGRIGKKNRQLYDMEIDETEGPIVQEIFNMACYEGYGTLRLANFLNEKYPGLGKVWTAQTLRTILHNIVYTGRMHMNDTVSQPNESLRLISDAQFDFAQYAMKNRIARKYSRQRQAENEKLTAEDTTKASVYGATLLSGLLYCAHCGHRLVGSYCTKQKKDGAYHRPVYRCYNGGVKAKHCDGQTVYSAAKIESAVLQVVRQYFDSIGSTVESVRREQARKNLRSNQNKQMKAAQAEIQRLNEQQNRLRQEVLKSLTGESSFDTDLLKSLLSENKIASDQAEAELLACRKEAENEESRLRHLEEQFKEVSSWAKEFDAASNDTKKMIMARIIQKITVDRDYHLTIRFFVSLDDFENEINKKTALIRVEQSGKYIDGIAV